MKTILNIKTLVDEQHFPYWGLAGAFVGFVFILIPQLFYVGAHGEPFSMFNHYVSELGELGVSELAMVFNIGLMVAGILFFPFMIGLGLYLDNLVSKIAAIVGAFSATTIYLVGVFPMNNAGMHALFAISFFFSGLIMTLLWALAILIQRDAKIPKVFALGGAINALIFALFLFGPWEGLTDLATRPSFNMIVTLEWSIYFAIVIYLLSMALYVWRIANRVGIQ